MAQLSFFYDKIVESLKPGSSSTIRIDDLKIKIVTLEKNFLIKSIQLKSVAIVKDLSIVFEKLPSSCTSLVKLEANYKSNQLQIVDESKKLSMLDFDKNIVLCYILVGS